MTASTARRPAVVGAGVTLGLAVGVIGLSFGVGAVAAGASVWQACAMSLLVFTGASQLSAVSVIAAGGTLGAALGGAVLLAARNGVYGLAMSGVLRGSLGRRLVAAQITIDESTAMAAAQTDRAEAERAFWVTGASVYVFWNVGTLIGALAGSAVDPQRFGLDAAFPAAFVGMIMPLLQRRRDRWAAGIGAGICLVTIPLLPVGLPILAASTAVLVGVRRP